MWVKPCGGIQSLLPLLAGGELIGPERRLIERHLIRCDSCRRRLSEVDDALGVLHLAAEVEPVSAEAGSLWPALRRDIKESRGVEPRSWGRVGPSRLTRAGLALAASLALTAGALSLWTSAMNYRVKVRPGVMPSINIVRTYRPPTPVRRQPSTRRVSLVREVEPHSLAVSTPTGDFARQVDSPAEPTH